MNPLNIIIQLFKPLLYPLSFLYGLMVWLRNKLYDAGLISSVTFSVPVISIGNLSTGGTGKTPHIEYLIRLLQYEYKVATMSRGYKRKSHGFLLADKSVNALTLGDEPMQFYLKFPDVSVSVCEDRMTGIPELLAAKPETDVILLDDAFQHRSVKAGLNILITDYNHPFYKDYILPFGSLRESRKAYKRAHIIIVSKCPKNLSKQQQQEVIAHIKPLPEQKVLFSTIRYQTPIDFFSGSPIELSTAMHAILIAGIARPQYFIDYMKQQVKETHLLRYPDHHYFTLSNIEEINTTYTNWAVEEKLIITTEKDAVRLMPYADKLRGWKIRIAVLPIEITFLENENSFNQAVKYYIDQERLENQSFYDTHDSNTGY